MLRRLLHSTDMGSFLSSLSTTPPDNSNLTEMQPLSRSPGPQTGQFDSDLDQCSVRRCPLNPNGHATTNLLGARFRRRPRTSNNTQSHRDWALEPLLTSANHGPNIPEHKEGTTVNGSQSGSDSEVNI